MLITIGSFDGFHKGHEKLFEVCRKNSINNDWGVVTFSPHPAEYMKKLKHSMFTLEERKFLAEIFNVPNFLVFNFDEKFKNLTGEEFINILIGKFNVSGIVCGNDFHFGCDKADGDFLEKNYAGKIKIFRLNLFDKEIYSSSEAREKILQGDFQSVKNILSYPFFMMSDIIHGNARGRGMNFPTANINLKNRIIPADGVYSTAVLVNDEFHCGALSIGNNPTFNDVNEKRAEVFIMDFSGDIYGSEILIFFLKKIRGIKIFENSQALMSQINIDVKNCLEIYKKNLQDPEVKQFLERAKEIYCENRIFNFNFKQEIIEIK